MAASSDSSDETLTPISFVGKKSLQCPSCIVSVEFQSRLKAARDGNSQLLEDLLSNCRNYLQVIAKRAARNSLRDKISAHDLIRETLDQARKLFPQFKGTTEADWMNWLSGLLEEKISESMKWYMGTTNGQSRQVADWYQLFSSHSTQSFDAPAEIEGIPGDDPRQPLRKLVDSLTLHQQAFVRLRIEERLTFDEIGQRMGCSEETAHRTFLQIVSIISRQGTVSQDEQRATSQPPSVAR